MLLFFRKLSLPLVTGILLIWTIAAMSMATQIYMNARLSGAGGSWLDIFFKQLPSWYLCALLTPFVLYLYQLYPLHTGLVRRHLIRHLLLAVLILSVFSNFRLWSMGYALGQYTWRLSPAGYIHAYIAQVLWDFVVYFLILMAVFAFNVATENRKNLLYAQHVLAEKAVLENLLKEAKLETLKLQLSPHFLFNTLHTINSLVRINDQQGAIQITSKLGNFLRSTLYGKDDAFVTLERELEHINLYLEIEMLRFKDRLKVTREIDERSLAIAVPHFILQPLLENAIKYGLAQKSNAGYILIKTFFTKDVMNIVIYNDGELLPVHRQRAGIGLQNVRSRLSYIYGGKHSFSIENVNDSGVRVEIGIPVN